MYETGRSELKVDGPEEIKVDGLRDWTAPEFKSLRSTLLDSPL